MAELDAFEVKVRQNIKLLSSPDVKARRKAAAWLGEAGEPSAITRLKQVYEEDPDAVVRKNAAYSLGMFRVLNQEMNGPNRERTYELIEDVQLRGKMGRRARIPQGCLTRLLLGLLVSLALILAFNFLIWPQYADQIYGLLGLQAVNNADIDMESSLSSSAESLTAQAAALRADVVTLQTQYNDPAVLDCDVSFNNLSVVDVTSVSDQPELAAIANRLNAQLLPLVTAKAPYNQACATGSTSLSEAEVAVPLASLATLLSELDAIDADMAALEE